MRTVFIVLEKQNEECITNFLDNNCNESFVQNTEKQWNIFKNNDGLFYINRISTDVLFSEMEDKLYFYKIDRLIKPLIAFQIDISGRYNATLEIKELLISILSEFEGYAIDNYSNNFWSLDEINNIAL
jgi:hypothetical protein